MAMKWIVIFITLVINDFITSTFLIFLKDRTLITLLFEVKMRLYCNHIVHIVGVVQAGRIKPSTTNNVPLVWIDFMTSTYLRFLKNQTLITLVSVHNSIVGVVQVGLLNHQPPISSGLKWLHNINMLLILSYERLNSNNTGIWSEGEPLALYSL